MEDAGFGAVRAGMLRVRLMRPAGGRASFRVLRRDLSQDSFRAILVKPVTLQRGSVFQSIMARSQLKDVAMRLGELSKRLEGLTGEQVGVLVRELDAEYAAFQRRHGAGPSPA
jgi:hypothetical protein